MEQPYESSIFPEKTVVYADFWTRFGAALIDGFILLIPSIIFKYMGTAGVVLTWVVPWLYDALQESGPL